MYKDRNCLEKFLSRLYGDMLWLSTQAFVLPNNPANVIKTFPI